MSAYMNVHDGIYYLIKNSEFYGLKEGVQGRAEDQAEKKAFEKARDILARIDKRETYKYIGTHLYATTVMTF